MTREGDGATSGRRRTVQAVSAAALGLFGLQVASEGKKKHGHKKKNRTNAEHHHKKIRHKGKRGPAGPTGQQGSQGSQGIQGPIGPTGPAAFTIVERNGPTFQVTVAQQAGSGSATCDINQDEFSIAGGWDSTADLGTASPCMVVKSLRVGDRGWSVSVSCQGLTQSFDVTPKVIRLSS